MVAWATVVVDKEDEVHRRQGRHPMTNKADASLPRYKKAAVSSLRPETFSLGTFANISMVLLEQQCL